jgi:FRG domain
MTESRVSSWNELTELLYAESWQPPLGRFRSHFAFRGMSDATADLTTSLVRLGGPFARQEGHLLRNFRKYAHRDAVPMDSVWNWLSLAQHHGLPTRLLDWSFSPYVAMHFATQDIGSFDVDGVIACIDYAAAHAAAPARLKRILRDEGADVFTAEMLDRAATTLPALDKLAPKSRPFVVFLEPPSLDDRIVNQFALFSLMSSPTADLAEWLRSHPDLWRRLIIPASLKWEVRDKLDQANITERVLFPGLDGLSRWLRRYYSPRGGK